MIYVAGFFLESARYYIYLGVHRVNQKMPGHENMMDQAPGHFKLLKLRRIKMDHTRN